MEKPHILDSILVEIVRCGRVVRYWEMRSLLEKFRERLTSEKLQTVSLLVFGAFLFVCSLEGVEHGFKLVFSEWANFFLRMVESGVAPFTGLAIGVLTAALLESSSAVIATAMVSIAGMVTSGLPLSSAIRFGVPMVLGANIGTTAGSTIVLLSLRRSTTAEEFNATIPGVILGDMYKILTVGLLFTIEVITGFLSNIATKFGFFFYDALNLEKVFTLFEKSVIDIFIKEPMIKPLGKVFTNFLGAQLGGIFFSIVWFLLILISIDFLLTRGLKRLILTDWADRVLSAFKSPFKSFATGFSLTWLVGSSSVGTSLAIPMIATKMVSVEESYPYLCGCGLATTVDLSQIYGYIAGGVVGFMLGSAHVILNILALIIWLVTPLRVIPLRIAKGIGQFIASNRHSALLLLGYALLIFIAVPFLVIFVL